MTSVPGYKIRKNRLYYFSCSWTFSPYHLHISKTSSRSAWATTSNCRTQKFEKNSTRFCPKNCHSSPVLWGKDLQASERAMKNWRHPVTFKKIYDISWFSSKTFQRALDQAPAVEHILAILVSLFWNETCKNVLARLKREKTGEIRRDENLARLGHSRFARLV